MPCDLAVSSKARVLHLLRVQVWATPSPGSSPNTGQVHTWPLPALSSSNSSSRLSLGTRCSARKASPCSWRPDSNPLLPQTGVLVKNTASVWEILSLYLGSTISKWKPWVSGERKVTFQPQCQILYLKLGWNVALKLLSQHTWNINKISRWRSAHENSVFTFF